MTFGKWIDKDKIQQMTVGSIEMEYDADIGWPLLQTNYGRTQGGVSVTKVCLGAVKCTNKRSGNVVRRASSMARIEKRWSRKCICNPRIESSGDALKHLVTEDFPGSLQSGGYDAGTDVYRCLCTSFAFGNKNAFGVGIPRLPLKSFHTMPTSQQTSGGNRCR
ncbi:uncharacterized protein BYT42DRAFT_388513 [Radiomyces spectabilis]|uniref:uncharacterized protein n=1 Tax=Radiomyces spectabilis TaxID=64574 RepID=UPI00221ED613|nr:uncharacterized protein BYT42DRAFT_388513 [Radiomyces spectabilis]KAI8376497.1 hypothetical protein BYT42DRAFT_388513 [Radiomyces spectabilis]